ncbi:MAG: hypothetical protein ABI151_11150 [Chitinophagaceae bacterium]
MSKSKSDKSKSVKKEAPKTGMIVKGSSTGGAYGKPSSNIPNRGFSSSKKGGVVSTPRKAK